MYSPNRFRKRVLVLESLESRVVLSTTTVAPIAVLVDQPFDPSAPSLPRHLSAKVDRPFDPSAPSLPRHLSAKVDRPFDPSAPSLPRHVSAKVDQPFDPSAPSLGFQVKFGRPTVYAPPTPLWARMRSSV